MDTFHADRAKLRRATVFSKEVWEVAVKMGRSEPYYYRRSEVAVQSGETSQAIPQLQGVERALRRAFIQGTRSVRSTLGHLLKQSEP